MFLVEHLGLETGVAPKDITGAAQVGDYMSLKNYSHCTVVLIQGAWAGGTPAVTLHQATDVAATGEKALAFTSRWSKVGLGTTTQFAHTAVVANTFNLPATANTLTVLEVDANTLDTTGGFDCLCVKVASPGANADLLAILYILSDARYRQAAMPDAKVD